MPAQITRNRKVVQYYWLLSLFVANISWAGNETVPPLLVGTTSITAEELSDLINLIDGIIIIDTRQPNQYQKEHIKHAISLPSSSTNLRSLSQLAPDKNTALVFYCQDLRCRRSMKSAKIALRHNYNNVYWFRGGIDEWKKKGYRVISNKQSSDKHSPRANP